MVGLAQAPGLELTVVLTVVEAEAAAAAAAASEVDVAHSIGRRIRGPPSIMHAQPRQ